MQSLSFDWSVLQLLACPSRLRGAFLDAHDTVTLHASQKFADTNDDSGEGLTVHLSVVQTQSLGQPSTNCSNQSATALTIESISSHERLVRTVCAAAQNLLYNMAIKPGGSRASHALVYLCRRQSTHPRRPITHRGQCTKGATAVWRCAAKGTSQR